MSECRKCIERAQTIRWLKCELDKVTNRYNEEFSKKQKATKCEQELENVRQSMKIDGKIEIARLTEQVQRKANVRQTKI